MSDSKGFTITKAHIGYIVSTVVPLWSAIVWGFAYEENLVKKNDIQDMATIQVVNQKDLDARIERTEIKLLIYGSRDLTADEQLDYDRAKARLIRLEAQRDEKED